MMSNLTGIYLQAEDNYRRLRVAGDLRTARRGWLRRSSRRAPAMAAGTIPGTIRGTIPGSTLPRQRTGETAGASGSTGNAPSDGHGNGTGSHQHAA